MTEHSKLPWKLSPQGYIIPTHKSPMAMLKLESPWREGAWDGDEEAHANAAYIVKCCNAFPDLVKVLTTLCDEIGHREEHGDGADDSGCSICRAHKRARKLLRSLGPVKDVSTP